LDLERIPYARDKGLVFVLEAEADESFHLILLVFKDGPWLVEEFEADQVQAALLAGLDGAEPTSVSLCLKSLTTCGRRSPAA